MHKPSSDTEATFSTDELPTPGTRGAKGEVFPWKKFIYTLSKSRPDTILHGCFQLAGSVIPVTRREQ